MSTPALAGWLTKVRVFGRLEIVATCRVLPTKGKVTKIRNNTGLGVAAARREEPTAKENPLRHDTVKRDFEVK